MPLCLNLHSEIYYILAGVVQWVFGDRFQPLSFFKVWQTFFEMKNAFEKCDLFLYDVYVNVYIPVVSEIQYKSTAIKK